MTSNNTTTFGMPHPEPLLEVLVHDVTIEPGVAGLCAGFEGGAYRTAALAKHLMEWLPEFALKHEELVGLGHANALRLIERAAKNVYATEKFQRRGEFGELLLHIALRQCFNTVPAIAKLFFKDGPNDTVKGFDAVHVVAREASLELWLGEVKFYQGISEAIRDVTKELKQHTERDYLRREFLAINNKIDSTWPHADRLSKLIDPNTSLDVIFDALCVPVMLTYDSAVVKNASRSNDQYKADFDREVREHYETFKAKLPQIPARVHLILLPLKAKAELVTTIDKELRRWQ